MAAKNTHYEIARFLESKTPEVLCVRGKWGVGKTFAWKRGLREAIQQDRVALKTYSYISLFGLRDLEEIKIAILENTRSTSDIDSEDIEALGRQVGGYLLSAWSFISRINGLSKYIGGAERLLFLTVRKRIICIDDLERSENALSAASIFGLVTFLKEERNCKIVLLLNEEEIKPATKAEDYRRLLEKTVDTRIEFDPTALEAADIAFGTPSEPFYEQLKKNCIELGITNLRVIGKIIYTAERIQALVSDQYPELTRDITHSVPLLVWSYYESSGMAPPIDFIKDPARVFGVTRDGDQPTEREKAWSALLQEYRFNSVDEFDLEIWDSIDKGNFDPERWSRTAAQKSKVLRLQEQDRKFSEAWDMFHESFENNQQEVIDALVSTASNSLNQISPLNLSGTVEVLKNLGAGKQAEDLIASYINERTDDPSLFDLDRSAFGFEVKDPDVRDAFRKKYDSLRQHKSLEAILGQIGEHQSWHEDDLLDLAKVSADDMYKLLKAKRGRELRLILKGAFTFAKLADKSPNMEHVLDITQEGLKRIAKESTINKLRVRAYGVKLDD